MKLKSVKRIFSAAFWPSLAISALAAVEPVYAVTPLAYLQSQTAPAYRPGNTMLRLARCGWPYLGNGDGGQLDVDTQKELAGRWGYVMSIGDINNYSFTDPNGYGATIVKWCKDHPGYEAHVWETRKEVIPTFADSPSCYLRRADGSAITDGNGNPIWSPVAPDSELLNISQRRLDYLNKGRQYGPITYIGNMGEYALGGLSQYTDGDLINYYSQDPTVVAALGSSGMDWWSYISSAKAHQEIVMHSKVASGVGELKHYYWYANGGSFDRNRYGGWLNWAWGYEWMRNITLYPSEQCYLGDGNDGFTGPNDALTKELNATGWQIRLGHPLAYTWVEGPRASYGDSDDFRRRWIGCLKTIYTLGTLGVNVGDYNLTNPGNQPDVDPANPPMWMKQIMDTSRVQGLFSYLEPFLRRSDLLPGPNMHIYYGQNPAYEFPVANDSNARVVARKMTDANRWLITAWAMSGNDRNVSVTIPVLGTVTLLARDVGSVYHYANGTLTQLDSSDGTLVTLDTGTLNAQLGDLYSASATSNAADDATFVSQSVPSTMVAGQQYAVSVTMKNNGTATWNHDGATPYNLGSQNPRDNTTWGPARVAVAGSISRGNLTTFNFTLTAPSIPGTYNFQWQMVHDGVTWFGPLTTNVPVTVPIDFSFETIGSSVAWGWYALPAVGMWNKANASSVYDILDCAVDSTHFDLSAVPNGSRVLNIGSPGTITQSLGTTVSAGSTITMTFGIGRSKDTTGCPGGSMTAKLLINGTAIASQSFSSVSQTAGTFATKTLTGTASAAGTLSIQFQYDGSGTPWLDNIAVVTLYPDVTGVKMIINKSNGTQLWRTGEQYLNYSGTFYTCTVPSSWNANNGLWNIVDKGGGYYQIINETYSTQLWRTGEQYLSWAGTNWTIQVPTSWVADNGLWQIIDQGGGYYQIKNKTNGNILWGAGEQYLTYGGCYNLINVPSSWSGDSGLWQLQSSTSPSMAVSGSGVISDNTGVYNYGAVATGSFLDHTFTITNNGSSVLNLTGSPKVTISGTNASDFSVTAQPASSSVAAGGSITFTVRFTPGAAGARTARVNITNNDPAKSPYDFAINGSGLAAPTYQAAGTAVNGLGAITPAWPAHQSGDVALLMVETANQAVSLSTPAGFVEVTNSPQGAGTAGGTAATRLAVYWKRATSSAEASPTVADSGDHQIAQIITFRGCASSGNPWDITAGGVATTASTAVSIPGATTTVGNTLVATIVANGTDTATAQTSAWANAGLTGLAERIGSNTSTGNGGGFGVATGVKTAAGAYAATTATLATSSVQGRLSIALKP